MRFLSAVGLAAAITFTSLGQDIPLSEILLPGEDWKPVQVNVKSISGLTADAKGQICIADSEGGKIVRLGENGEAEVVVRPSGVLSQLRAGPRGLLYAFKEVEKPAKKGGKATTSNLVVAYDAKGKEYTVLNGFEGTAMVVCPKTGRFYLSGAKKDGPKGQHIFLMSLVENKAQLAEELAFKGFPDTGFFAVSPDEGTVAAAIDSSGWLFALRVEADGALKHMQPYWSLRAVPGQAEEVSDMTFDRAGRLFVASDLGIQFFDPTGRLSGVLLYPRQAAEKSETKDAKDDDSSDDEDAGQDRILAFGGPEFNQLYLALDNKLFVRTLKAKGVPPK